ncbi:MAG: dxr [Rickettsiaceae bacterium]|nr:dxr [Rickettsiaceae bacterium]
MKTITILGSTGSIGCNTVKVINQSNGYSVVALTAKSNVQLLAKQARELKAKVAVIEDESLLGDLKAELSGSNVKPMAGGKAVIEAAERQSDIVMSAIVGAAGLLPTMAAVKRGSRVALANKECLVCAGDLMMNEVKKSGGELIPVDSEHSAIFQIFDFKQPELVSKIVLTASGGPFRTFTREQMAKVTPKEAVNHPNWSMGSKISVDSATMMNKGIEVVVHPESIVHSMVEYHDGSVLAQLGTPDMCTPISVALSWPSRIALSGERLDLVKLGKLTFEAVDNERFPAIGLARAALAAGGAMPAVFNTANEVAVAAFLKGQIGFLDIAGVVAEVMEATNSGAVSSIEEVMGVIAEASAKTQGLIKQKSRLAS